MTIVRWMLLICLGINLVSAPVSAAGAAVPGGATVIPGDVFSIVVACSQPIASVSGVITAHCPLMPAVSPWTPVAGARDASAASIIVPGNVSRSTIQQAERTPAFLTPGALRNVLNAACSSSRPVYPFPPGCVFSDALRCYLVTIGAAALPSVVSAAPMPITI